jgi:hypothetical protein
MMRSALGRVSLALALLALAAMIFSWTRRESPAPQLRPSPQIPVLDIAILSRTSSAELLPRIELECTRRVLATGQGWRSGPEVLSTGAAAIWAVGLMEPAILQFGFSQLAMGERDPALTPQLPSLSQAADAYDELGLRQVGGIVRRAADLAAGNDAFEAGTNSELNEAFRRALGKGSEGDRVMYARRNLAKLFPAPSPTR